MVSDRKQQQEDDVGDNSGGSAAPAASKIIRIQIYGMAKRLTSIEVNLDEIITIQDLKDHLIRTCKDPSIVDLNIIKKGAILNDLDSLAQCDIVDNCKIYAISKNSGSAQNQDRARSHPNSNSVPPNSRSNGSSSSDQQQSNRYADSAYTSNSAQTQQRAPNMQDIAAGIAGTQMPQMPNMGAIQQQLMKDPKMMQEIMNSPSVKKLMSNPEFISNIMKNPNLMQSLSDPNALQNMMSDPSSNPMMPGPDGSGGIDPKFIKELMKDTNLMNSMFNNNEHFKKIFDKNPHLKQVLSNPDVISDIMDSYSSKAASDQMNYMNDVALSQIENMGAFNQVENMFSSLTGALDSMQEDMSNNNNTDRSQSNASHSGEISSAPSSLPNPWNTQANTSQLPRNPTEPANVSSKMLPPSSATQHRKRRSDDGSSAKEQTAGQFPANYLSVSPLQSLDQKSITAQHLQHLIATNPKYLMRVSQVCEAVKSLHHANPTLCQAFLSPPAKGSLFNELLRNLNMNFQPEGSNASQNIPDRLFLTDQGFLMHISRFVNTLNEILRFDPIFYQHFFRFNVTSTSSLVGQMSEKMVENLKRKISGQQKALSKARKDQQLRASENVSAPPTSSSSENIFKLQLQAMTDMGFNRTDSLDALKKCNGNIDFALNHLLKSGQSSNNMPASSPKDPTEEEVDQDTLEKKNPGDDSGNDPK